MPSAIKQQIKGSINEHQVYCRGESKQHLASAHVMSRWVLRAGLLDTHTSCASATCEVLNLGFPFWRVFGLVDEQLCSKPAGLMLEVMAFAV